MDNVTWTGAGDRSADRADRHMCGRDHVISGRGCDGNLYVSDGMGDLPLWDEV